MRDLRRLAINQDGRTYGITMPSTQAQESLIRSTYQRAMLSLSSTRYLEVIYHPGGHQAVIEISRPMVLALMPVVSYSLLPLI